ncbi:hypothetical protein VTJ83DRAFT_7036 [Remersonia thermophila]|uniref:Carrier domain-containing protein n=1 Tax=Remersonia thermophila TaxID=72144 RepID=A0ABR4D2C0_9PEZI
MSPTAIAESVYPASPEFSRLPATLPPTKVNGNGVSMYADAAAPEVVSAAVPASLKKETVLLAWLITLLRTSEEREASFEWSYTSDPKSVDLTAARRPLVSKDVVESLDANLDQITANISRYLTSPSLRSPGLSGDVCLVLSTGTLDQAQAVVNKDGPTLHITARLRERALEIRPVWYRNDMLPFTVRRLVETLLDTVSLCTSTPTTSLSTLLGPTTHDLDYIWSWNHDLPPTYDACMHDIISQRAQQHPDKQAIDSWDGSLTYREIEQYSTVLAHHLRTDLGVQLRDVVPVCFEKSRWTTVAVLGVMKAGATMVLMDPTLPLARLQNMAKQVGGKVMVTGHNQRSLGQSIIPEGKLATIDADFFALQPDRIIGDLPEVPPSTLMYIIFTSGSTGTPKGVQISHRSYTSSAYPRAAAVGYNPGTRTLDFASYAFDVSIDSMLLTLANGGCLCIPSDEARLNDINGAMRNMRVNYAGITPSVARILDDDVIDNLTHGFGLGGEAVSARDVNVWGKRARIVIGYGPCECTIGCTVNSSAATGRDYISIGPGNGACIWIADPDDHDKLVPVGAVGEILVEGPIVGQGYLNDPAKTAASFIEDPKWLVAGHGKAHPGRQGRLYKTGDLGRYDPDGSGGIVFVGRKDTQVKLRGQRVELGEIESQLTSRLPQNVDVVAEVVVPKGAAGGKATLVAFVAPRSVKASGKDADADLELATLGPEVADALVKADAEIAEVLPRYMVPTAYIPVNRIPTLVSGKTDRKRLKAFAANVDLREVAAKTENNPGGLHGDAAEAVEDRPLTEMETRLRAAWAAVLKVDVDKIRAGDNFFVLGGDSLAAMRLSSVCREAGLDISVANTFGHPTLSAMASVTTAILTSQAVSQRTPFSLLPQPAEPVILEASQACATDVNAVEDMYPCTPTQESLFTFSLKSTEPYVAQRVAKIPSHISTDAWKHAWEQVVSATPILRSRLVQMRDFAGLGQVVLTETIPWRHSTSSLDSYLASDRREQMGLGQPLTRYAIVEPATESGARYMVWTLHHAVYDGWSEPIVLARVRDVLQSAAPAANPSTTMADFVHFLKTATPDETTMSFWAKELAGATGPQFPRLPSRDFVPSPDVLLTRHISLPATQLATFPFTLATLIRGAWALVSSLHAGSHDIVFGETLMGRDIPLPGVESVVGPLIATVPIRVRVDSAATVHDYLATVQRQAGARVPHQHRGMQYIRRASRDAQYACEAPSGLVIQPEPEHGGVVEELGFQMADVVLEAVHFNPYPLMLACGIDKGVGGFRVAASFDSRVATEQEMGRVLAQLETVCRTLVEGLDKKVGEVDVLPQDEKEKIWGWNAEPPMRRGGKMGGVMAGMRPGDVFKARAAIPWVCQLRNPSVLAPVGCPGELWLESEFLTGDGVVDSPAWLTAGAGSYNGRKGKVQPTGIIVILQEDGSLVFVGHKDEKLGIQDAGYIVELEGHLATYLPETVRYAVAAGPQSSLVVFLERPGPGQEDGVEILAEPAIISLPDSESLRVTVSAGIPTSLSSALKRLDKFAENSLPSHLVPSGYIVVDDIPTKNGEINREAIEQLASNLPSSLLDQLRQGFQRAWTTAAPAQPTTLTTAEQILRAAWAAVLGILEERIDPDDNFFRLGGDSVLAMKLVSRLRSAGHVLTVADIFRHMRLSDAAKALKLNEITNGAKADERQRRYKPFSLIDVPDADRFVADVVRPNLQDKTWTVKDVYPVTDSQALDVAATVQVPRTSVQYTTLRSADGFDRVRLAQACQKLVNSHDILRTVFVEHESSLLQVVLSSFDVSLSTHSADSSNLDESVSKICNLHLENPASFRLGAPLVHCLLIQGPPGSKEEVFVFALSHALYDGVSLPILLHDLSTLYSGQSLNSTTTAPFASYLSLTRSPSNATPALAYWRNLLEGSQATVLPGQADVTCSADKAVFLTASAVPANEVIKTGTTTASLLSAAWALLLARRAKTKDVTFGSITSGRTAPAVLLDAGDAVIAGPCYQFTPVRVRFDEKIKTAADLLAGVQRQAAESSSWDFLGVSTVAEAVGWENRRTSGQGGALKGSHGIFFDSVVHHQDWDDFDEMEFGDGKCTVDIVNPHGDAARPLKVVSFVKGGEVHVGLVGYQEERELLEKVLEELAETVRELTQGGGGRLLEEVSQETAEVVGEVVDLVVAEMEAKVLNKKAAVMEKTGEVGEKKKGRGWKKRLSLWKKKTLGRPSA